MTLVLLSTLQIEIFFLKSCIASCPLSTKITDFAPRDRASRPKAPVPAKRSKISQFSNLLPNLPPVIKLKIDSLTRSLVGLKCADGSPFPRLIKFLPLLTPAIIRTISIKLLN